MEIDTEPLKVDVRILNPPKLRCNKQQGNKVISETIVSPILRMAFILEP